MPPPKRCLYGKCTNTSKTNEDESVYFVPFPKLVTARTRNRVEKWVKACGNGSVNHIQTHHDTCFVCSTHFVGGDGPTKLNPDPIPYVPDVEPLQVKLGIRCRKVCAVSDCNAVSTHDELTTFHTFPKHHLQLELWRTVLKLDKDPPRSKAFVCSKHFISGMKSDYPSHPDYLPSIFASSSVAEIKALRQKLREFESGYAKLRMERNCAALRKHWYECGFTRTDLIEGVRRAKSEKRKVAQDEKMEAEAKKRREMEAESEKRNENTEYKLMSEMKEESMSDFEECDEEFVIENDRAEESEEEFDLSRVKEEPMSDSDIPGKSKDSLEKSAQDSPTGDGLRKVRGSQLEMTEHEIKSEPQDDEYGKASSPGMDRVTGDFCDEMLTVHFGNQGNTDNKPDSDDNNDNNDTGGIPVASQNVNYQCTLPHTVSESLYTNQTGSFQGNLHNRGSQLLNPVPNFGFPSDLQNFVSVSQPLFTNVNPGIQSIANATIGQQQNTNQNLAFKNNLYSNQIPLLNLGYQSNTPYNVFEQAVQFMGFQRSEPKVETLQPCSIPQSSTSAAPNNPATDAVKTVVALDPNTYQSPITAQTTFVVPKENIITLSLDGGKDDKEMLTGVAGGPSSKSISPLPTEFHNSEQHGQLPDSSGDIPMSQPGNKKQKQPSRTSSMNSEQSSFHLSCDEASCDSVSSVGYQPSSSASEGSTGVSRPVSCDIESVASGTINKKVSVPECDTSSKDSFQTEPVQQSESNNQGGIDSERAQSSDAAEVESPFQEMLGADADSKELSDFEKSPVDADKQNSGSVQTESKSGCQASSSQTELPSTHVSDVPNSKMCQTKESISKEATLKRHLSLMGVEVTSEQMKYLLKQKLYPSGVCPAIQQVRKCEVNSSVQAEMDKYVIPDLSDRCVHLANEVKTHKQRLQSMTYDFLNSGASKNNVLCHTGCYTIETLKQLFEYVSICLDIPPVDDLSQFQEFVMTLMKLRLGLHNYDLAFRFEVEPAVVLEILTKWVTIFVNTLSHLITWPEEDPERTEHRNQRWRLLKLRYDLLQAYDGIESMKDKWLLQQDLDDMIKICDVLNSFQVDEKKPEIPPDLQKILPEPVQYFIEEIVVEDSEDECLVPRHSSSESSTTISPADLAEKEILDTLTKVPTDVSIIEGKETEEGSPERDPSLSMARAEFGEAENENSLHEDNEPGTEDNAKEDPVQMSKVTEKTDDTDKTEEKETDSSEKGPASQDIKDLSDDVEMLSNGSADEDLVWLKSKSPDGKDPDEKSKHRKISNVYYVDDSEGVLIGAPEFEVEICDSENDHFLIDVSLQNSTSVDM